MNRFLLLLFQVYRYLKKFAMQHTFVPNASAWSLVFHPLKYQILINSKERKKANYFANFDAKIIMYLCSTAWEEYFERAQRATNRILPPAITLVP